MVCSTALYRLWYSVVQQEGEGAEREGPPRSAFILGLLFC